MWEELDRIPWRLLRHNYGAAKDVPGLLRGCADDDRAVADRAFDTLENVLYHQGGHICSAAGPALPFLLDLAAGRAAHVRVEVIGLIARLAREGDRVRPRDVDDAWPDALAAATPALAALLGDEDPAVRRAATRLARPALLPALRRRRDEETDPGIRRDLVLALGAAGEEPAALHRLLADDDPQTRLAAVHALAAVEPELPGARVAVLIEAVALDTAGDWRSSAWLGGTAAALVRGTGELLRSDPVAAAAFTVAVGHGPEQQQQAAELLARWRTTTAALLPLLVGGLSETGADSRFRAAFLLGGLGPETAVATERIAGLLDEPGNVGDAALWALARRDDPRCLPGLVDRLTGARLGFGTRGDHATRFTFWLPGIHEVLTPLREHAGTLLDAVLLRIAGSTDPVLQSLLCDVVAAWATPSADAVAVLRSLLAHDDVWPAAARALGGLGPDAAPATDELLRRAAGDTRDSAAAWALWRITGDPQPATERLIGLLDTGARPATLRDLADVGPAAARADDRLRQLARTPDDWVRAEAAHALWRLTGDPAEPVAVLLDVLRPLSADHCVPVMRTALRHLVTIDPPAAAPIARAVLDEPRRLAYFSGWRAFTEDQDIRAVALALVQ